MESVPEDLASYIDSFSLPSGATIRRGTSDGLEGWCVALGAEQYLYSDGSVDGAPRYRAFDDLGLTQGEDDLQGKPDSDWAAYAERQKHYSRLLIMPLDEAWKVARENGVGNRMPRDGEEVTIRKIEDWPYAGLIGHAVQVGDAVGDHGFVTVRLESGEEHVFPLRQLILPED